MQRFLCLLTSILIFSAGAVLGQKAIEIDEKVMPMSRGKQPGLEFMIPEADVKEVQDSWEKYMRSADRPDIEKEKDEIQALNATVASISNQPMNIYGKFTQLKEGVYGQIFFQLEDDFMSSKNNGLKLEAAKKYVYDFALEEYKYALEEKLDAAEDRLKDLEKEKDKLIKSNDKIYKTISENEREIVQLENDIKINEADQDRLVDQIGAQKELIIGISAEQKDALKEAEKELSSLENDYKKLKKKHEKMHKDIDDAEEEIREAERELKLNKADLSRKEDEVLQQKAIVEVAEEKVEELEKRMR